MPGRMPTWQSPNSARSVVPAWPVKVISYVVIAPIGHTRRSPLVLACLPTVVLITSATIRAD